MTSEVRSWELVDHFFNASVSPERLDELIGAWDEQIARLDPAAPSPLAEVAGSTFARQIGDVLQVLEQLQAVELQRIGDLLASVHTAAMVLTDDGAVLSVNDSARAAFGLEAGGSLGDLPLDGPGRREFGEALAEVARSSDRELIVQLRPAGLDRLLLVHLKAMPSPTLRPRVLAVTSEQVWPEAVSDTLARVFALIPAEIEVARLLSAGGSVGGVSRATGRSPGTVRSQLHAVLQKTGTAHQAELLRLTALLQESARVMAQPQRAPPADERRARFLRLPDGRRVEVQTFGDPAGRPVIWMTSTYGFYRMPQAAEAEMARRRLRVLVPFRAGWCGSDPFPKGSNPLEVAVADLTALMDQLRIAAAPLVAPGDDIRLALMFAQAEPARVRAIFGIGSGFPILNDAQYRRLSPIARFFRTSARYSPMVLPFMTRTVRATIVRYGIEPYLRGIVARSPADMRAFADASVAAARVDGVEYMVFRDGFSERSFCAEIVAFHRDWPEGLGQVACPVTLIHGEHDANAPFETALDYCALYPAWRYVGFPDEGELVAHVRWREVLGMIEEAAAPMLAAAGGLHPPTVQ